MPPKRRSALGRSTPDAKRVRLRNRPTNKNNQAAAFNNVGDTNQATASDTDIPNPAATLNNTDVSNPIATHNTVDIPNQGITFDNTFAPRLGNACPALHYSSVNFNNVCSIGELSHHCSHCNAIKFKNETKGFCCGNGKHKLDELPRLPPEIHDLYYGHSLHSEHFLSNLRKYNCVFQMTSFGCQEINITGWNPNFRIQGQIYHLIGSLMPNDNQAAAFLQIYFLDASDQIETRMSITDNLKRDIVHELQHTLHTHNSYIRDLKSAYELAKHNRLKDFNISIQESARPMGEHARRYNAPTCKEIAILMPSEPYGQRDIIISSRSNELRRICELHPSYDPLQYPLLFPTGNDGWSLRLKFTKKVSQLQFYRWHFLTRPGNHLLFARRLLQQFMVDVYAKIESERLQFLRREQGALRADNYKELHDAIVAGDGDPTNVGQKTVLPATFTGGPRYMFERQQDAMSYVRLYGRPDLFITMTTNPRWTEIKTNLYQGQQAHDRPDLVVRVFKQKLQKLMDLLKGGAFGKLQAWLYSIEFQKRGLPHAHLLLWLTKESKIPSDAIDYAVRAEIPDKNTEPELYTIVTSNMIHGPCGQQNPTAVCMKNGMCSKGFPKAFLHYTEQGTDSYPKYRRRHPEDGGFTARLKSSKNDRTTETIVDNRWIVPYNPWLLHQLDCHINVEICTSVKSIKYVLKYVHKGNDQATFHIQPNQTRDEIKNFINARYIGSTEAAWRIFEFSIHERYPSVVQLAVHLQNGQRVYFTEETAADIARREPPTTTLTAFFKLCSEDEFAANLLYVDLPRFYTWNTAQKMWKRRKQGKKVDGFDIHEAHTIGRVYTVSPRQGECFFLRILLHHVKGPRSFDDVKTVRGAICDTFRKACQLQGLLDDDITWHVTMQEAGVSAAPHALRFLLAIIITQCNPSDVKELWTHHKVNLTEDFKHRGMNPEDAENSALVHLEDIISAMGGNHLETYGLDKPRRDVSERRGQEYLREISYDLHIEREKSDRNQRVMTTDQTNVFKTIMAAVNKKQKGIFFLDAPGGCGKTFVIETILSTIRAEGKIALATASSGLAATLLSGGKTVHSTFKVPLDINRSDQPLCSIKKGTSLARLIQDCSIIIVDEAPMLNKAVFEAMDRTFKDIKSSDETMGGIPVMLCGDFRQILPVVRSGTRANIVNVCLKKSYLWPEVKHLKLTTNMRVQLRGDNDADAFSQMLLKVGDGKASIVRQPDMISVTDLGIPSTSKEDLINKVFPDFLCNLANSDWLSERVILAPLNEDVTKINTTLSDLMPVPAKIFTSLNTTLSDDDATHYPTEFLNTIELAGLPPHILPLKTGMPVMILRSLNPPRLMNGTRCVVTNLMANVVEVKIASGPFKHEKHLIPRIKLQPSDTTLPFTFQRQQFPLRPCFALTINKAQGQSFKVVGLDLQNQVFSHGMLYVALSRTGRRDSLHILTKDGTTSNVVYTEVLD